VALQTTAPEFGGSVQAALQSPGTKITEQVLSLVINDPSELAEPVVLVLDDYRLIENGEIHRAIELLVERLRIPAS
jgi:LuxR family maltose regulon positive regulatory protein